MKTDFLQSIILVFIGIVLGLMMGNSKGASNERERIHKVAIENNAGEYDSITGKFKWRGKDE